MVNGIIQLVQTLYSLFHYKSLEKKGSAASRKPALVTVFSSVFLLTGIILFQSDAIAQQKTGSKVSTEKKTTFTYVEKMPQFPGGDNARVNFLSTNLKYPTEAKKQKIEGRVTVKFIVSEIGKIIDAEILKSPNDLLSEEALRVVKAMPDWIPGENEGKKVSTYFTLPIAFQL